MNRTCSSWRFWIPVTTAMMVKQHQQQGRRIYHYPGCSQYEPCKIDERKGERWFLGLDRGPRGRMA